MGIHALSPAAAQDVEAIGQYLFQNAPHAELKVLQALEDAIELLADKPYLGHIRPDLLADSLRVWEVYRYLIIYDPSTEPLRVVRVVHASRHLGQYLLEEEQ